jgi:hypothetical protein
MWPRGLGLGFVMALASGCTSPERKVATSEPSNILLPFTTDGCSNWPDGSWQECCIIHDRAYWKGGTQEERDVADEGLKQCVSQNHPKLGPVMEKGTNLGGGPDLPTSYRWGYGWKYDRDYGPLSASELAQVEKYWPLTKLPPQILQPPYFTKAITIADRRNRRRQITKHLRKFLGREVDLTYFAQTRAPIGRTFEVFEESCPAAYFLISFSYESEKMLSLKKFGDCPGRH